MNGLSEWLNFLVSFLFAFPLVTQFYSLDKKHKFTSFTPHLLGISYHHSSDFRTYFLMEAHFGIQKSQQINLYRCIYVSLYICIAVYMFLFLFLPLYIFPFMLFKSTQQQRTLTWVAEFYDANLFDIKDRFSNAGLGCINWIIPQNCRHIVT